MNADLRHGESTKNYYKMKYFEPKESILAVRTITVCHCYGHHPKYVAWWCFLITCKKPGAVTRPAEEADPSPTHPPYRATFLTQAEGTLSQGIFYTSVSDPKRFFRIRLFR